jgi:hypothetical protein
MSRIVSWFSCGAASAVATMLSKPDVIAYCDTGAIIGGGGFGEFRVLSRF